MVRLIHVIELLEISSLFILIFLRWGQGSYESKTYFNKFKIKPYFYIFNKLITMY